MQITRKEARLLAAALAKVRTDILTIDSFEAIEEAKWQQIRSRADAVGRRINDLLQFGAKLGGEFDED